MSRLRWFGHVMQTRDERIPKKILHTQMEGKRPTGSSRIRWIDQIRKDMEIRGENWEEIQDNRKWKNRGGWIFLCNSRPKSLEMTEE